jgi:CNT family concentrative nucleoside transporter
MERLISFSGLFVMLGLAWLFSNNRRQMNWRIIIGGIGLQFLLAVLILRTTAGEHLFGFAQDAVQKVVELSDSGARFMFGKDFSEHFFAFKVLPTIIFISSLSSLLFYWGIMQRVINVLAWVMYKVMGISGTESLVTAANIFMGQTEAPLLVRPYISNMTRSEINIMMVSGMATVAGGVLAAFVDMGISAGHLMAASMMSAPASIVIGKVMVPEEEVSSSTGAMELNLKMEDDNAFAAACRGASEGLHLALNVGAMLIAFISLMALVNLILGTVAGHFGYQLKFEDILGVLFSPLAYVMGIPWEDCLKVGQLLGVKTVLNEFIAYQDLAVFKNNNELSQRSVDITTYALCGFANFSSIAIQIGGIGSLAPERRKDFAKLGFKAMIGGTLATFMTACIAGILI